QCQWTRPAICTADALAERIAVFYPTVDAALYSNAGRATDAGGRSVWLDRTREIERAHRCHLPACRRGRGSSRPVGATRPRQGAAAASGRALPFVVGQRACAAIRSASKRADPHGSGPTAL